MFSADCGDIECRVQGSNRDVSRRDALTGLVGSEFRGVLSLELRHCGTSAGGISISRHSSFSVYDEGWVNCGCWLDSLVDSEAL